MILRSCLLILKKYTVNSFFRSSVESVDPSRNAILMVYLIFNFYRQIFTLNHPVWFQRSLPSTKNKLPLPHTHARVHSVSIPLKHVSTQPVCGESINFKARIKSPKHCNSSTRISERLRPNESRNFSKRQKQLSKCPTCFDCSLLFFLFVLESIKIGSIWARRKRRGRAAEMHHRSQRSAQEFDKMNKILIFKYQTSCRSNFRVKTTFGVKTTFRFRFRKT